MWIGVGLLAALLLAACDSADPIPSEDDPIDLVQEIADTTLRLDGRYTVELHDHFRHRAGAPLTFGARPEGDAVAVTTQGGVLTVMPQAPGSAVVVVTATSGHAESKQARFSVDVLCPSALGADEASYFPNAVGQEWTYDYYEYSYPKQTSPYEDITTGTLHWRIIEREDRCAQILLQVEESFEGQRLRRFMGQDESTNDLSWKTIRNVLLDGPRLLIPDYTDGSFRGLDSLRWLHPQAAPEVVQRDTTVFCGFGGCTDVKYALRRNVGLAEWTYQANHRDVYTKSITLRP